MKKIKNRQSMFFEFADYKKLLDNQILLEATIRNLFEKLNNPEILNNFKEYLNFDEHFDIELDLKNAVIDYSIVNTDAEACIYINIKIFYDKKDITKNEQIFFFIYNENVELDII